MRYPEQAAAEHRELRFREALITRRDNGFQRAWCLSAAPRPRCGLGGLGLVPGDFADLASRSAIDKTLQRLAALGDLRRVDRGFYDRLRINHLSGRPTVPDYRAVTRRDQARALIDGMTAANQPGLTTAVPARIEVLVDARLKSIKLGNQEIHVGYATPSRLCRAGRPYGCPGTALDAQHALRGQRASA